MRIFVSSTCYDLLDVRAEVGDYLRELELNPVLSDEPGEFVVSGMVDSIEECLANVASSEQFVLLLDRRYGPSLEKAGYPDKSATHLEYDRAVAENIPRHVFVRDRTVSDYEVWKKDGRPEDFSARWILDKDVRLLQFIDEHVTLFAGKGANWYTAFKNVVDLKRMLRQRFGARSARHRLVQLAESGALPMFTIATRVRGGGAGVKEVEVTTTNRGALARSVTVVWTGVGDRDLGDIDGPATLKTTLDPKDPVPDELLVSYTSVHGFRLTDQFHLVRNADAVLRKRTLRDTPAIEYASE